MQIFIKMITIITEMKFDKLEDRQTSMLSYYHLK